MITNFPAIERCDGTKVWYLNGERHREDGPAVEDADGSKYWWLNGKKYNEKKYWTELHNRGIISESKLFVEVL